MVLVHWEAKEERLVKVTLKLLIEKHQEKKLTKKMKKYAILQFLIMVQAQLEKMVDLISANKHGLGDMVTMETSRVYFLI